MTTLRAAYKAGYDSAGTDNSSNPYSRLSDIALWHAFNAGLEDARAGWAYTELEV